MYQDDLQAVLVSAGLPVSSVVFFWNDDSLGQFRSFHQVNQGPLSLTWQAPPTLEQVQAAAQIIAGSSPSMSERDVLDTVCVPPRVLIALLFRASSGFSGLSAARRQRIQSIIDDFAAKALNRL